MFKRKPRYKDPPSEKEKRAFEKYLSEDEELIVVTSYSAIYLRQKFIIYILLPGAVFILLGLGVAYYYGYELLYGLAGGFLLSIIFAYLATLRQYYAHRYLLTTRRVMIKQGYLNVKLTSALYDKITHIEVDQDFYDRFIMHHGTVIINTAGMNKNSIELDYVDSPIEFKNLLERLINREREQYGRQMEQVVAVEGELVE